VNIDNHASLRIQQKLGARKLCAYPGAVLFSIPIQ
jgi:hypothetical protein